MDYTMSYGEKSHKGRFTPRNPSKYRGDISNITYRSSWERAVMKWCDENSKVSSWSSEEVVVPYMSPLDGRMHRYFVDFLIEVQTARGAKRYLTEVKPFRFTQEPKIPKRKTRQFLAEVAQWGVNNAKWDAARIYAKQRGWEFMILTERDLGSLG